MSELKHFLGLDYGSKRIGWALADSTVSIAVPQGAITVDGQEIATILGLVTDHQIDRIVLGYPRNQAGEATQQTVQVEQFAKRLRAKFPDLVFQDESLTSAIAEDILDRRAKPYAKADIDALAAALILDDYLEEYKRV